jgi:hypothetical protein
MRTSTREFPILRKMHAPRRGRYAATRVASGVMAATAPYGSILRRLAWVASPPLRPAARASSLVNS